MIQGHAPTKFFVTLIALSALCFGVVILSEALDPTTRLFDFFGHGFAFPLFVVICLSPLFYLPRALRHSRASVRMLRENRCLSRGHCPKCNYSFAGSLEEHCAECGYKLSTAEFRRLARIWSALQRTEANGR